jgi:hypothetical protein
MSSTVPIRSSMIVALALCLAPSVLGQSPATGCGSSQLGVGCPSAGMRSVPPSISQPPTTTDPRVTYAKGKLAITAQNATMRDLLRAVSLATGAVIEFPNDHAAERMSASIGPGAVRDVLTTLLNGSGFNYVMLGSQNDPSTLQRLILTNAEPPSQAQLTPAQSDQVGPLANGLIQSPPRAVPYEAPAASSSVPPAREAPIIAMEPPKEPVAPEALGQMMRDLAQQIRQKQQEQQQNPPPPQQNAPPPPQ